MKTLGQKNRNPLNIRYNPANKWLGQRGQNKGFCVFNTSRLGYRAALILLRNYYRKGFTTVSEIITRWAPENENDTSSYIKSVCDYLSITPDYQIQSVENLCGVCAAMALVESRSQANAAELVSICNQYSINL